MGDAAEKMRIGVLISGGGTNLQAIIDASRGGQLDADVVVVIANHEGAYGLERARKADIPAIGIDRAKYDAPSAYNHAIREILDEHEVDLVVHGGLHATARHRGARGLSRPCREHPSGPAAVVSRRIRHQMTPSTTGSR